VPGADQGNYRAGNTDFLRAEKSPGACLLLLLGNAFGAAKSLGDARTFLMKANIQNLLKPSFLAAAIAALFLSASAYAADPLADLSFTGRDGSPLTVTLNLPVSFLITTGGDLSPVLIFQGVGDLLHGAGFEVTGNITFTINGGDAQSFNSAGSGFEGGAFQATDLYFYGDFGSLVVGDTVVVSSGTLATLSDVNAIAPDNGLYSAILADAGSSNQISDGLGPVPEPATWATAALVAITLLWKGRRRIINIRYKNVPLMTQMPNDL